MSTVQGVQSNLQTPWNERSVQNGFFGMSAQEVTCFALRSLGVAASCGGIALVSLAIFQIVAWPVALFAIPCAAVAMGFFWSSHQFFDYENPEVIQKYRHEALHKHLDQIASEHGWTNLLRHGILLPDQFVTKYREQVANMNLNANIEYYEKVQQRFSECPDKKFEYQIPHPSEWRRLWRQETQAKTFEEIVTGYSIENLERYSLLEIGELNRVKALKGNYDSIKRQHEADIAPTMRRYENGISEFKRTYDRSRGSADFAYNHHAAVVALQDFEHRVTQERLQVQNVANQRKQAAQGRFDLQVAPLTDRGKKSIHRLSPEEMQIYNNFKHEFQLAESRADAEANEQLVRIDVRVRAEKEHHTREKRAATQIRDTAHQEAKRIYDAAIAPFCQTRDAELAPFTQALQSSLNDLTLRYRAYLRTINA